MGLYEVNLGTGAVASRYKHTDALGSPVATTDAAKAVLGRTSYCSASSQATESTVKTQCGLN